MLNPEQIIISMSSWDHADGHGDYSSGYQSLLFLRQEHESKPGCVEGVRILQQTRCVYRILVRYRISDNQWSNSRIRGWSMGDLSCDAGGPVTNLSRDLG